MTTGERLPDHIQSLRDRFALHLQRTRAEATTRIYLDALDGLIRFLKGNGMPVGVSSIRREHVEAYLAKRRTEVRPATLSIEYRALTKFWRWAVDEDELVLSPMARMTPPTVPAAPMPIVSEDDFKAMLVTAQGKDFLARRDTAVLLVFFDTGARLSEVAGMQLDDVDIGLRLAHVTGSRSKVERAVRFGAKTAVAVDRYLKVRAGHRMAQSPALWLGQDGPLTTSGISQVVARRARAAGLPRVHPQQLRRTFAHQFLEAGGQEGDLRRLAGWRSAARLRRYGPADADRHSLEHDTSPADRR
jgi:site-specific recombinase XerC